MSRFFFTPGPSQIYYTVEAHLKEAFKRQIPSISHRSSQFEAIYQEAQQNIKALLGLNEDQHVLFLSSATEAWERIGQNLVEFESFHFVNGAFSGRFQSIMDQIGRQALSAKASEGSVVDIKKVLIPESSELIALTHNETSTGASQPIEDIYTIRKSFPNQLIAVDVVSSAPMAELDYSKIDTAYFSVQKCFGLPAGLGVWVVNDRCIKKCEKILDNGLSIGSYHSLPVMLERAVKNQTVETPNVLAIYLLGKVAGDMLEKGIDQIRREINYKSAVLYQAFEQASFLSPFVQNETHRSKTTPVAHCDIPSSKIIEHFDKMNIELGSGYGKNSDKHIRIANFPTHSKEHIEMIADTLCSLKF